ncbi:serine hydrolase [Haloimpatiens lingqiaonensis]|uniref:serine hydrolase n=1 Tax=Haloimpatiens lingqiaonensis TaxID=1380675 RepID=UPI0010FDCA26|nr:serine hydrolase [Haloimpatiens lingqiaonensis]
MKKKIVIIIICLIIIGSVITIGVVSYKKDQKSLNITEEKLLTKGKEEKTNSNNRSQETSKNIQEEKSPEEKATNGNKNLEGSIDGYKKIQKNLESNIKGISLEEKIKKYLGNGIDRVGLIYYDLNSGEKISINGDKICTAASTYKVGMNMVAYNSIREGRLGVNEKLKYRTSMYESGTGILQNQMSTTLKKPISVQKLLDYSIKYSDNIATNMLSRRLGGVQAVRRKVCDITGIQIDTKHNVITPEMEFRLLKEIYDNRDEEYNAHLIEVMKNTVFHDRIDKYIPSDIVAHKIGNYGSYTNDVGIVFADNPYIFVMYVDGLSNASEKIAEISEIIYNYNSGVR